MSGSPRPIEGWGRVVAVGIIGVALWVAWLWLFSHPSDTPESEAHRKPVISPAPRAAIGD
jgi:hypothetical protein